MKKFIDIKGFTSEADCLLLQKHAKNKRCLEIGTFIGRSAIAMAEVAKLVDTVDTHKMDMVNLGIQTNSFTTLELTKENIKGYDNINVLIGDSRDVLPQLDKKYGLIFIDGDHSYNVIYKDITNSQNLLTDGGVLLLHDFYLPEDKEGLVDDVGQVWEAVRDTIGLDSIKRFGLLGILNG